MDNNNFLSGLSKSLIEATKQVLEGKSHTLPKTDDEKDLAALAAPHGKITKKDVLVGRGVVKEEEQIDELSKATLKSYVKKSTKSADKAWDKSDKEEDKAMATDGMKYPEKQQRHMDAAAKHIATWRKRDSGLTTAKQKLAKEEVEQVDEVSKKTLGSYVKKAGEDLEGYNATTRHAEKALKDIPHGTNARSDMRKTFVNSLRKADNRKRGIDTAIDKLTKEELEDNDVVAVYNEDYGIGELLAVNESTIEVMFEEGVVVIEGDDLVVEDVEDLSELSKDTLNSYTKKAQADPAFDKKKGKPSKATVAVRAKRTSGLEAAKAKLHAIAKKESEAHAAEMAKHKASLGAHFEKEAPKVLAKHGYKKVAEGVHGDEGYEKHVSTYVKGHENGHVSTISIQKKLKPDSWGHGDHDVRAVNSKGTSYSNHSSHGTVWDKKDHEKHMTDMMPNFESHVIKVKNDTDNKSNW